MTAPKNTRGAGKKAAPAKAPTAAPAAQRKRAEPAPVVAEREAETAVAEEAAPPEAEHDRGEREPVEAFAAEVAADAPAAKAEAILPPSEAEHAPPEPIAAERAGESEPLSPGAPEDLIASQVITFAWPAGTSAAIETCGVIGLGICELSREWIGWAHDRALRRVDALAALARVKSPIEAVTLSGDVSQEDWSRFLAVSGRVGAIASNAVGRTFPG
jgi:hypothetical protein